MRPVHQHPPPLGDLLPDGVQRGQGCVQVPRLQGLPGGLGEGRDVPGGNGRGRPRRGARFRVPAFSDAASEDWAWLADRGPMRSGRQAPATPT